MKTKILERTIVFAWMRYLNQNGVTIQEAHERNNFFRHLLNCCRTRTFTTPFHKKPPNENILNLNKSQRGYVTIQNEEVPQEDLGMASNVLKTVLERSPDKGAFLMAQPVPRCGAYCYLAVVSRNPNKK